MYQYVFSESQPKRHTYIPHQNLPLPILPFQFVDPSLEQYLISKRLVWVINRMLCLSFHRHHIPCPLVVAVAAEAAVAELESIGLYS